MQTLGHGQPCKGRPLHAGVAVEAVNAEFGIVMLVAERNRLCSDDILPGYISRIHDTVSHADCGQRKKRSGDQDRASKSINLWPE